MNDINETYISPWWPSFQKIWWIVLILLLLALLLMQILGYGFGRFAAGGNCAVKPVAPVVESVAKIVPDTVAPAITLNEDAVVRITAGDEYVDAGALALDNLDGEIDVTTSGQVDPTTPGEYVVTYSVTDAAGNTTSTTRTIFVDAKIESAPVELPVAKLFFENDSAEFPADIDLSLSGVIAYMRNNSQAVAVVQGYHSATGGADRNKELSKQRAQSVSVLLQESGVEEGRIILEKPLETTGSGTEEEARRVEVYIAQ